MVYDIFYVSKNIINEQDWKQFRSRFPSAQKIDNVASFDDIKKKAFTKFFWVIWDDLTLIDLSIFEFKVSKFEEEFIHVFKNRCNSVESYFGGVVLFPKNCKVISKEFQHRFFLNKKEHDVVASEYHYPVLKLTTYDEYIKFANSTPHPLFWGVWSDIEIVSNDIFDLYFDPNNGEYDYDRNENHMYKNSCNGVESYLSGVVLFSTKKIISEREFNLRFLVDKKEHDIVISKYRYPQYIINNYQEYTDILKNETQKMFWCIWPDVEIINTEIFDFYFDPNDGKYDYDRSINHMFKNRVGSDEFFVSGIALCSTDKLVSKKEFDHRFFIDKKEHDQVISRSKPYDKFVIEKFEDYKYALDNSSTDMFWFVPPEIEPLPDFDFSLQFPYQNNYERSINHVFKNKDVEEIKYNGIMLLSKQAPISAREVEYRYLIEKKEYDIVASELKLYDIVFISYNEPNADENFTKLIERFPRAKRVHGVKGIHQAHIAAAKLATTPMFWVVDGDAVVEENFKFNLLLPKYDTDIVHVWLSRNPVNDLKYGYGGVKLLPKTLTENMDVDQIDMTMSISNKFKVVQEVSNITAFNTDPFNTWKSAFRECVKLASRPVDPGYQEETEDRLHAWCILGGHRPNGKYAIQGAKAGKKYGIENISKLEELAKINDFEWLLDQFQNSSPLS
jgi:hypothetical protein